MCYAQNALENYDSPRQQLATLEEMQDEVRQVNIEHGWYEQDRSFGDDMALLTSEVSEAYEAYRNWGLHDATDPAGVVVGGVDLLAKPEGVGSELADVFIRLLDTCERTGVDLRAEYVRKMAYNRTRPYKHGNKRI